MSQDQSHQDMLQLLIEKAAPFQYQALPNPAVGAMIVKEAKILAVGIHKKAGSSHAEIEAINQVSAKQAKGASLYITLEPCSHHGKTPPCVDAIIKAGFKQVIYALKDPNPLLKARDSKTLLQKAGIEVIDGLLEEEARLLHAPYLVYQCLKRPFMCAKIAMSLDGKIASASGESLYLTGPEIRRVVHQKREDFGAVLVGIGTILADDPQLTVRHHKAAEQPTLIVLDSQGRLPKDAICLKANRSVICFISDDMVLKNKLDGVTYIPVAKVNGHLSWPEIFKGLMTQGVFSVFVEGGQGVFSSLNEQKYMDSLICCVAPFIMAQSGAYQAFSDREFKLDIKQLERFTLKETQKIDQDVWLEYLNTKAFLKT